VGQNQCRIEVNNLQSFAVRVSFPLSDPVEYMGDIDVYEVDKLYVQKRAEEVSVVLVLRDTERWKLAHVRAATDGSGRGPTGQSSAVSLRNLFLEDPDLNVKFNRFRSLTFRVGRVSVSTKTTTLELFLRHPGLNDFVAEFLEVLEAQVSDHDLMYPILLDKCKRSIILNESLQYTLVMEVVTVEKRLMYSNA
jgi:hypothetical protein